MGIRSFIGGLFRGKPKAAPAPAPAPEAIPEAIPVSSLPANEQVMYLGEWTDFSSTNVSSARYLYDDKIMEVVFNNGGAYQYFNVPPSVFLGLLESDSAGRYIWNHVRDIFEFNRVIKGELKTGNKHKPNFVVRSRNDLLSPAEREALKEKPKARGQNNQLWD